MTLTEFLLARIAEDEAAVWDYAEVDRPRWLAECEAKRRIILQQQESERVSETDDGGDWAAGMAYAGELAIRDLAAIYADHPDYRDEWRR